MCNNSIYTTRPDIIDKINHFTGRNESFLFAIDFNGEKGFVLSSGEAYFKGIMYYFGGPEKLVETDMKTNVKFDIHPVSFEKYKIAFDRVSVHLKRGDTYLLNLTFPTSVDTTLSLFELYNISRAPYKLFVPGYFAIFSPEPFIRIADSKIYSCPMKGTINAAIPDAEQHLLADEKEFFEHNTIIDLIRNDLSMISAGVHVSRFRYIDRIHTNRGDLLQMSSEICGELPPDFRQGLGEILFTLLPAGSVTGAPKKKTVEIIRETESYDRGFYTGIFGFYDGFNLNAAVSIRFIEQTDTGLVFKSGGGITSLSDPESEYNEMINKVYVPVV